MKFSTRIMLILLFGYITNTAQNNIEALDSANVKIPLSEFKFIIANEIELNAAQKQNDLFGKEVGVLKNTIADKDKIIDLRNQIVDQLNQQIEDSKPAWWNKFSLGFGTAGGLALILILMIK